MAGSYQAVRDFSKGAFALGSARRRSGTQGVQYVPGPSAPIPGAVTPEGALAKVAHAIVAGRANRQINDAVNRQAMLEDARQAQLDQIRLDEADPTKHAQRVYDDETARLKAERENPKPSTDTMVGVPKELQPYLGTGQVKLGDITHYRALHGLTEFGTKPKEERRVYVPYTGRDWPESSSVVSEYMNSRPGAPPKRGGGKYDAIEESERSAEAAASQHYEEVRKSVKAELLQNADPATKSAMFDALDAGVDPPQVLNDSRVRQAATSMASTRGGNILRSLARAGDYDSIAKAVGRFYVGDPLKADPRIAPVRKMAILKAADLARTQADVHQLFDATTDPGDPLNKDPDVAAKLQQRLAQLPE